MKYHFIYPDINTYYIPSVHHGVAQLFSVLKQAGHEVSLSHITKVPSPKKVQSIIQKEKPDYVCFTSMSNQIEYVKLWSQWIKEKFDIPIICGGIHATLNPEDLLTDYIDYVCVGEGENPLLNNEFWHKSNGEIVKGKAYPYIEDLDSLPYSDYTLFDCVNMLKRNGGRFPIICSRGCRYDCSYCANHALRHKQAGKYARCRSVSNVIGQLEELKSRYPIKSFSFADDIFGINKEWVVEFCEKYPKEINIPFDCNLRVEMVAEDLLKSLKNAGCEMVEMGIESGNEWIRKEILNRRMTNNQIINVFDSAHKLGLKTRAYNMIGLPEDTPETVKETINLNKRVKPSEVAVFYFYPFKGTKLYDVCKDKGYLTDKQTTNYVTESILNLPSITNKELKRLYNEFYRFVISRRIKFPLNIVAFILRLLTFGNDVKVIREVYTWSKS